METNQSMRRLAVGVALVLVALVAAGCTDKGRGDGPSGEGYGFFVSAAIVGTNDPVGGVVVATKDGGGTAVRDQLDSSGKGYLPVEEGSWDISIEDASGEPLGDCSSVRVSTERGQGTLPVDITCGKAVPNNEVPTRDSSGERVTVEPLVEAYGEDVKPYGSQR